MRHLYRKQAGFCLAGLLGFASLLATSTFAVEPKVQYEISIPLKLVEITYAAAKQPDDPDPTGGAIRTTVEVIERVGTKGVDQKPASAINVENSGGVATPSVESVKTTTTTTAPRIPMKPKSKGGTTTGQLRFEGNFKFDGGNTFNFRLDPKLLDGLRVQLQQSVKKQTRPVDSTIVIRKGDPQSLQEISVRPLAPFAVAGAKPQDAPTGIMTVTILVQLSETMVQVNPGDATTDEDSQTNLITISNNSSIAWPYADDGLKIKNGSTVIYDGARPDIPAHGTVTLTQRRPIQPTPQVTLRQVLLNYSPPAAATASPPPAIVAPPTPSAGTLAVGTQQVTIETIEEPKGNVKTVKTTSTAVATTDAPKSTSTSKTATTTGLLIYQGQFGPRTSPSIKIDPSATKDEEVVVELTDSRQRPIGWKLDSDRIPESKITKTNPQKKAVTLTVIPQGKIDGQITVRLLVPLSANKVSTGITYAARMDNESQLIQQVTVQNLTAVDWQHTARLTVKVTGDQIIYDEPDFAPLSANGTRTVSQNLSVLVDSKAIYVDLASLTDAADKAKADNVARLPRLVKFDNGQPCKDGKRLPLPAGTNIQLKWSASRSPLVKQPDSATLKTALPLGTNTSLGDNCCGPIGVCAVDGPYEKSPFIAFVPVGEDARIGVISATRSKSLPFIPLALTNGELSYLMAEHWKFKVCALDAPDAANVRYFDSRPGMSAFYSQPLLKSDADPGVLGFSSQYEPRSISTSVLKLSALDGPGDLVDLLNAFKPNLDEVFKALADPNAGYSDELGSLFCLAAYSRKLVDPENPQSKKSAREYLQCLRDQLDVPFIVAANYKLQKEELARNQRTQMSLEAELQLLIVPSAGDQFGLQVLKYRLELEKLRADEKRRNLEIQRLGSDLIQLVSKASSCGS